MLPLYIQYDVSFCSIDLNNRMVLRVTDAIHSFPLPVKSTAFQWISTRDGTVSLAGELFNLGPDGCNSFKLAADQDWLLSISAPGYYPWSATLSPSGENLTVAAALQPLWEAPGAAVSVVLTWGGSPADYDLWLLLPNRSSEWSAPPGPDGMRAVSWREMSASDERRCGDADCVPAQVNLTQDAAGGFGPEALLLDGDLPEGRYAVLVSLNADGPVDVGNISLPVIEVYAASQSARVLRLQAGLASVGVPSPASLWWHALDLNVASAPGFPGAGPCVAVAVVDAFTEGYAVDKPADSVSGSIRAAGAARNSTTLSCAAAPGAARVGVRRVVLEARSAVDDALVVADAVFDIAPLPPAAGGGRRVPVGDVELADGRYGMVVTAGGYVEQNQTVVVGEDTPGRLAVFLVPTSKDRSFVYVALRWPRAPAALDLLVMPLGMPAGWEDAAQRPVGDPRSVARAYAGRDVGQISWVNGTTGEAQTLLRVERYEAAHGAGGLDGPQVVSLRWAVAGQYRVYVAIPPLAECVAPTTQRLDGDVDPVFQAGGEIYVDVYIRDRLVASERLDRSGGKWWNAGYVLVPEGPGAAAEWVGLGQTVLMDPVTLFYGMVRLVVMDSVAFGPDTDYSRVEYTAYRGGLCECPLFTATCACFGDVMASGQVGPDSDPCGAAGCQDTEWTQAVAGAVYLPRERSLYSLHVRLAGYVDRVVGADAWMDGEARVVMVPVPRPGELRIVLTWAQVPLDLDLWVIPAGDVPAYTYWNSKGPHSGVRLDTDCTTGYGPESVTLAAGTLRGAYRVAVNAYSYNGQDACGGTNRCEFQGGETVEFFESWGRVKTATMEAPAPAGNSWWLAGVVTVEGAGAYSFEDGAERTTCGALMRDAAGVCRGAYCCDTCNSNCGECSAACAPTVQVRAEGRRRCEGAGVRGGGEIGRAHV